MYKCQYVLSFLKVETKNLIFLAQKAEKRSGRKLKMQMRKVKKEIPQPGFEPRPPNSKTDHMSTTPPELSCERCKEIDTYTNC